MRASAAFAVSRIDARMQPLRLKTQVSNDEGFIEQVKGELETKKQEWKDIQLYVIVEFALA